MGNSVHAHLRSGGASAPPDVAHAFSVRISVQKNGDRFYLQYIRPNGSPVWGKHKCNYVSRINQFSSAQRICREVFQSDRFPPGTMVQFHKQFFRPVNSRSGVIMNKMFDRSIKNSTVIKP